MDHLIDYPMIRNVSVVDTIKEWFTDQLIKGNLKPGDKLPTENELCTNLGASRNSVREAIKQLEANGVVYIKRAEGTYITNHFSPQMMSPIFYDILLQENSWYDFVDMRRAIDIGTLYVLLDQEISEEKLQRLEQALTRLEEEIDRPEPDIEAITDADNLFHTTLIKMADNLQMMTLFGFINRITIPSRQKTTQDVIAAGKLNEFKHLHRQIYQIVVSKDKSAIETVVKNHYVFWDKDRNRVS